MNEVMAILKLWIGSSKSVQELNMKLSLINDTLSECKEETERRLRIETTKGIVKTVENCSQFLRT